MKTFILSRLIVAGLLVFITGGCVTKKLWGNAMLSFCEPAVKPDVALFETSPESDILVAYNAFSDRHDGMMRLAYFARINRPQIATGRAPHFVNPNRALDMRLVPIIRLSANTTNSNATKSYATISSNGRTITLYRPDRPPEVSQLPEFRDDHGTFIRVALTPLAVTADVTIVGAAAAVVAGCLYVEGRAGGEIQ